MRLNQPEEGKGKGRRVGITCDEVSKHPRDRAVRKAQIGKREAALPQSGRRGCCVGKAAVWLRCSSIRNSQCFSTRYSQDILRTFAQLGFSSFQFDDEEEEEMTVQNQSSCLKGCGSLQGGHELTAKGRAASCRASSLAGAVVASFPLPAELRVPTSCHSGCHLSLRPCPINAMCQLPAAGRHLPS